ncbi:MAG TPA: aldehyde dehydrogenase family protein [Gaiellaceae bacterium]|nr:aldehyde dehydrogenase family protein [Gaiellaceae bacterium]
MLASIVGGHRREGDESVVDLNPASPDEHLATTRLAGPEIVSEAIDAAADAFPEWRDTPSPDRGSVLRRAADLLEEREQQIARDLASEEGKTLGEALGETRRAAAIFRYYSGQTLEPDGETYPSHSPQTFLFTRREPLGVVAAITPWNFPIAIPAWKIAPAIAFGNSVVWKPAEIVPLTSTHLAAALHDASLPAAVLNLVLGRGSIVGDGLVAHERVDALSFTGSNAVGRAIQLKATAAGKKVQLELGGKNPAVVLADADLELAAEHVARGAFLSAGQKCTATSRVIVEQAVFDEFSERLAAIAKSWPVGDPLDEDTKVGPLSCEPQLETVSAYLRRAESENARILAGGNTLIDDGRRGYFVELTVLTDLPPTSAVVREEIFGPVAALLPASSYDQAVHLANDTPFGLTAALFTRDLGKALRFSRDARAGVVKINQESAGLEYQVPFGGMRESSSGTREQGKVARDFFTQWKTIYLDAPGDR